MGDELKDQTKDELYERAQELEVEGRSNMSKDELIEAISKAEGGSSDDEPVAQTPSDQHQDIDAVTGRAYTDDAPEPVVEEQRKPDYQS
jgi:transcription termination factor Rho